jgi:hypothetical protein
MLIQSELVLRKTISKQKDAKIAKKDKRRDSTEANEGNKERKAQNFNPKRKRGTADANAPSKIIPLAS